MHTVTGLSLDLYNKNHFGIPNMDFDALAWSFVSHDLVASPQFFTLTLFLILPT